MNSICRCWVDRVTSWCTPFVVSTGGGSSIEAVAHDPPEKILTITLDQPTSIMPHHGVKRVAKALGLIRRQRYRMRGGKGLLNKLYEGFIDT